MRTDDVLDLADYYEARGRVLTAVGELRDLVRLRNRRERQWSRLFAPGDCCSRIETIFAFLAVGERIWEPRVLKEWSKISCDRDRVRSRRPACG